MQRPAGPHTGVAPLQSPFDTHCTHIPVDVSQTAVLPTQAAVLPVEH
jgi:hypothetical protein